MILSRRNFLAGVSVGALWPRLLRDEPLQRRDQITVGPGDEAYFTLPASATAGQTIYITNRSVHTLTVHAPKGGSIIMPRAQATFARDGKFWNTKEISWPSKTNRHNRNPLRRGR